MKLLETISLIRDDLFERNENLTRILTPAYVDKLIARVKSDIDWSGGGGEQIWFDYVEDEGIEGDLSPRFRSKAFLNWFRSYVSDRAQNIVHDLQSILNANGGLMPIFRQISAPANWDIAARPLGRYWSYIEDKVEAHWGSYDRGMQQWVMHGMARPEQIDWFETIARQLDPALGEDEAEIYLLGNQKITVTAVFNKTTRKRIPVKRAFSVGESLGETFTETILSEKRRSNPIIVYHGTSADKARSILKHGMLKNPRGGRWKNDSELENSSQMNPTRASLSGSYWTSNLGTAKSSATNTLIAQYRGSGVDWRTKDALIVIAQVIEQTALADEDSVQIDMQAAWTAMVAGGLKVTPDAIRVVALCWYGDPEKYRPKMIEAFEKTMHEIQAKESQPIPPGLAQAYIEMEIQRQLAHYVKGMKDYDLNSFLRDFPEGRAPVIPSVADAERAYLEMIDRATRYYRKTAYRASGRWSHTLRVDKDVGFSGRTKIIGMLTYNPMDRKPVKLLYGSIPEDFIKQWENTTGPFPGVEPMKESVLTEKRETVTVGRMEIDILYDPSAQEMVGFLNRTIEGEGRGLLVREPSQSEWSLALWDAFHDDHTSMSAALRKNGWKVRPGTHLEFSKENRGYGSRNIARSGLVQYGPIWGTNNRTFRSSMLATRLSRMKMDESTARTLYHGTARENIPSIREFGIWPSVGEFTKNAYQEAIDAGIELRDLVFAADKNQINSCISAIGAWINHFHPEITYPYTREVFERYGALCVLKHQGDDFNHRDEEEWDEHPEQVERGDYYTDRTVYVDFILTGKKLVAFLARYGGMSGQKFASRPKVRV